MKKEKQIFWNNYSSRFDSIYNTKNIYSNIINICFRRCIKIRFNKTIENIPETTQSVLDIGCGPGYFCVELSKKNIPLILGIDFSKEMIEIAKKNAMIVNIDNHIDFRVCDFFKFSDDRKFEYSIMIGFVEYIEDPIRILNKAIEITQKQIFISIPKNGGVLAFQRKLRYKNRCYLKLYSRKELIELLTRLNISSYQIESNSRDYFVTITV